MVKSRDTQVSGITIMSFVLTRHRFVTLAATAFITATGFSQAHGNTTSLDELRDIGLSAGVKDEPLVGDEALRIAKSLVLYRDENSSSFDIMKYGLSKLNVFAKGTDYYKDYDANEIKADQHYLGKSIVMKGFVQSINKDAFGTPYLSLNGGANFGWTHARFGDDPKAIEYLSTINKKDIVTLHCTGAGLILANAVVKDCEPLSEYYNARAQSIASNMERYNDAPITVAAMYAFKAQKTYYENLTESSLYLTLSRVAQSRGVSCPEVSSECADKANQVFETGKAQAPNQKSERLFDATKDMDKEKLEAAVRNI